MKFVCGFVEHQESAGNGLVYKLKLQKFNEIIVSKQRHGAGATGVDGQTADEAMERRIFVGDIS